MAGKLAMRVFESGLSPTLKPTAATMALFGNDAGERIYPSVDRLAYLMGLTRRTVERQLSELRAIGVLVPESSISGGRLPGGRGRSVLYRLNVEALPTRNGFEPRHHRPRHHRQGSESTNPDTGDRVQERETPAPATETPTPVTNTPTLATENPEPVSDDL
jgi:hypothetical protein